MSNVRQTAGAVLATVTQTATTVTEVLSTVSDVVTIANTAVQSAKQDQADRQKIHRKVYRDGLLTDARMAVAERDRAVADFIKESDDNKALYESATEYLPDNIFD